MWIKRSIGAYFQYIFLYKSFISSPPHRELMKLHNQPLFCPRGSVRAVIAITITLTTMVLAFVNQEIFRMILPLCALVVGYYFGKREK